MNWKCILIVVILVTVVSGGILAWQFRWLAKEEIKPPEVKPPEGVEDETAKWKTYRNEEISIEFQYPSEWGELITIKESSEESPSDVRGTKISICRELITKQIDCSFQISAFTQDYKFFGMQEVEPQLEYLGRVSDKPRLNCSYYELKPCESFTIQGRKAVSVYLPFRGYISLSTIKTVLIENSDQKFSGIVINQFIKGLTRQFSTVEEVEENKKDYILAVQEALSKSALLVEALEDLEIFNHIVSTFKFTR